jgi:hypothetical protein
MKPPADIRPIGGRNREAAARERAGMRGRIILGVTFVYNSRTEGNDDGARAVVFARAFYG